MQPNYTSPAGGFNGITPLRSLLLLTGCLLLGMTLGALLADGTVYILSPLFGQDPPLRLLPLIKNPARYPNGWPLLMIAQGVNHLFNFLIPVLVYWKVFERSSFSAANDRPLAAVSGLGLVVMLVIIFMPFNALLIEWNQNLTLPETLAPVEKWMRAKEDELSGLTKFLTSFTSTGQLVLAILIIAIIPAIGEEALFRGVLQRNFIQWTGNMHVGIWLAAAIFSAIHIQFYGFFPRMLLGALFGYLYAWSGNLWVPILAHFVNNGFTVLMVYLNKQKVVSVNIEETESVPVLGALVSMVLSFGILYYFRQINQTRPSGSERL
nr:CPBP family intramembrane glutamic endopeptidase [uncultured Arsenicibacter sp.]